MANLLNQLNLDNLEELEQAREYTYKVSINHRKYSRPKDTLEKIERDKLRKQKFKNKQDLLQKHQEELDEEELSII